MEKLGIKIRNQYDSAKVVLVRQSTKARQSLAKIATRVIGPMEKGFGAAKLQATPTGVYENVDLSVLPKYICYRAAMLREKQTLQIVLAAIVAAFSLLYLTSRLEVSRLQDRLRMKEYILAPGVVDFTSASPQSIPDGYISDAVSDFIANLGNVNPSTINEQYGTLMRFMSDKLRVEFELDTADWVEQVKTENISQLFTILDRQIKADANGWYKATIIAKADFYADRSYLGHENHAVEMTLKLMPPESGKRWYLQIESLTWNREETHNAKRKLSQGN